MAVAATALMAGGMMFANTLGTLPASTTGANPGGRTWATNTASELPGVVSTQEIPTVLASNGVRPGVGAQTGEMGSASPNDSSLPGVAAVRYAKTASNF